jgi:PAS domain S-box-containing protein
MLENRGLNNNRLTDGEKAEEALRPGEEPFKALIHAISQIVYRMSPDWKIMYSLSGGNFIPSTTIENNNWLEEYIPAENREMVLNAIQKAIETKSMFELEHPVVQLDGSIGWTYSKAIPILNDQGEITEWFGAATDTSQRKKIEEDLKKSEERFKKAFNSNPNPATITRISDFIIIDVNTAFLNLFEFSSDEVIGHTYPDLDLYSISTRNELLTRFLKDRFIKSTEIDVKTKSGHILKMLVSGEIITFAKEDHLLVNFVDISEQKRVEEALKRSEERFHKFFNNNPNPVCITRVIDSKIMDANEAWLHLLEYKREEVIGHSALEINLYPENDIKRNELLWTVANKGLIKNAELELISKTAKKILVLVSAELLNIDGVDHILSNFIDITRRKQAEEELKKSESRHRKFFESGIIGVIFWGTDGRIKDANDKFLQMTGYTRDEIKQGKVCWTDITPERYRARDQERLKELNQTGWNKNPVEKEYVCKDGSRINVLISGVMMDNNLGLAFVLDITERKKYEEQLQRDEKRHRRFFESGLFGAVYWNIDGRITEANDKFIEITGFDREEFAKGQVLWNDLTVEEHRQLVSDKVKELLEGGQITQPYEADIHRKDGQRITLLISAAVLDDTKKEGIAFALDISERKKWEKELQQSEERFSKAFFNGPSAAILTRQSDKKTLAVNSNFLEMFGFLEEEVIGRTTGELNIYKNNVDRNRLIALTDKQGYVHAREIEMLTRFGKVLNVLFSSQIIFINGENHYYLNLVDITDRKIAENALKRSEELWVTTLSSINEAVIATDQKGIIKFINPEAECLMGWRKNEVINRPVTRFYRTIDEITRKKNEDPVNKILREGISYREKNHKLLIRKEGEEIPIEESGAPIKNGDEEVSGIVLVFHDVTEHKLFEKNLKEYNFTLEEKVKERTSELVLAKEQAESADRLKTSFLLTMSHELRTPLNSIIGFSGILNKELAGPLNEEQKKQTTMIFQSGRHLLHLVNDILDMSKIEVGKLQINIESFEVGKSISQVMEIEKPFAEKKGLAFHLNKPEGTITIESDPARFQQVILNLVHNAVKFTDQGYVSVEYGIEENNIYVTVSDSGIGIKEENIPKLFISFSRVQDDDLVRSHEGTGSGLGLAISRKIMDLLHGSIEVKSTYGKGSIFKVTLPLS